MTHIKIEWHLYVKWPLPQPNLMNEAAQCRKLVHCSTQTILPMRVASTKVEFGDSSSGCRIATLNVSMGLLWTVLPWLRINRSFDYLQLVCLQASYLCHKCLIWIRISTINLLCWHLSPKNPPLHRQICFWVLMSTHVELLTQGELEHAVTGAASVILSVAISVISVTLSVIVVMASDTSVSVVWANSFP